jgi:calpain-15
MLIYEMHQFLDYLFALKARFFKLEKLVASARRNSEKSQRSQLDLCVVVFRTRSPAAPQVGRLVEHSKRQVRGFVGCHKMLERDLYIVVCLAFNHWHTGMEDTSNYPEYVLAIHSSKRLLVEQISPPAFVLADAIISLTLAKGQRHEVNIFELSSLDHLIMLYRIIINIYIDE